MTSDGITFADANLPSADCRPRLVNSLLSATEAAAGKGNVIDAYPPPAVYHPKLANSLLAAAGNSIKLAETYPPPAIYNPKGMVDAGVVLTDARTPPTDHQPTPMNSLPSAHRGDASFSLTHFNYPAHTPVDVFQGVCHTVHHLPHTTSTIQ